MTHARFTRVQVRNRRVLGLCARAVVLLNGSTAYGLGLGGHHLTPPSVPAITEFGSRRNLEITAAGIAATWFATAHEDAGKMQLKLEHTPGEGGSDVGNVYGDGLVLGAGTAALWTYGHFTHNPYAMDTASDLALSLVISGAVTTALKVAIHRTRPNGGPYSFPSGHTSGAFAVAPILAARYGWKAGVPAYTLALMTGLGRMEDRKHFASDVLAGATVGLVVGRTVAHHRSGMPLPEHLYMASRGLRIQFQF